MQPLTKLAVLSFAVTSVLLQRPTMKDSNRILGQSAAQERRPCYAFLRNGDVWVTCEGKSTPVTPFGNVIGFAVSGGASHIAVRLEKHIGRGTVRMLNRIVSLRNGFETRGVELPSLGQLSATCGMLLFFAPESVSRASDHATIRSGFGGAHDVISGGQPVVDGHKDFRCSSDQKVVVGLTAQKRLLLQKNGVQHELAADVGAYPYFYDVSPGGKFVSYYVDLHLCAKPSEGSASCVRTDAISRIPITDSGDVIFETRAEQECFYKDSWHFSPKHLPGYEQRDACPAVAFWHPGMTEPRILERLAGDPQWIEPKTAQALLAWRRKVLSQTWNKKK